MSEQIVQLQSGERILVKMRDDHMSSYYVGPPTRDGEAWEDVCLRGACTVLVVMFSPVLIVLWGIGRVTRRWWEE